MSPSLPSASSWAKYRPTAARPDSGLAEIFSKLDSQIPERFAKQWQSLRGERDPDLLAQGLLAIGRELKFANAESTAITIFQHLGKCAGSQAIQAEARHEAEAILGQGDTGARLEYLTARFGRDATDYKTIAPMMLGTAAAGIFKAAALSQLAVTPAAWWSRGKMALAFANGFAFAGEAGVFAASARGLSALGGVPGREKFSDDFKSAAISIGALKLSGALGNYLSGKVGIGGAPRVILQQGTTFLGMRCAHFLEEKLKLRDTIAGATGTTDTLASMLSMGVGAHLGHGLLGKDFAGLQAELEARVRNQKVPTSPLPWVSELLPALAGAPVQSSRPTRIDLPLVMMSLGSGDRAGSSGVSVGAAPKRAGTTEPPTSLPPLKLKVRRGFKIDRKTLERMEPFPSLVSELVPKEPNPVFFGLNHLKWWNGLIHQHGPTIGAEAIFLGGKILFARWPEGAESRKQIEAELWKLAQAAEIKQAYHKPNAAQWWRPFWEFILEDDASEFGRLLGMEENRVLAGILQRVRSEEPESKDAWLQELSAIDADAYLEVEALLPGETIESSYPQTHGLNLPFHPDKFNEQVAQFYGRALESESLDIAFGRLLALRRSLDAAIDHDAKAVLGGVHGQVARWFKHYAQPYLGRGLLPGESSDEKILRLATLGLLFRNFGEEADGIPYLFAADGFFQNVAPSPHAMQWQQFLGLLRSFIWSLDETAFPAYAEIFQTARRGDWQAALEKLRATPRDATHWLSLAHLSQLAARTRPRETLEAPVWFAKRDQIVRAIQARYAALRAQDPSVRPSEYLLELAQLGAAMTSLHDGGSEIFAYADFVAKTWIKDPQVLRKFELLKQGNLTIDPGSNPTIHAIDHWLSLGQWNLAEKLLKSFEKRDSLVYAETLAQFASKLMQSPPSLMPVKLPAKFTSDGFKKVARNTLRDAIVTPGSARPILPDGQIELESAVGHFVEKLLGHDGRARFPVAPRVAIGPRPIPSNVAALLSKLADGTWSPSLHEHPEYARPLEFLLQGKRTELYSVLARLPFSESLQMLAFLAKTVHDGTVSGLLDYALTDCLLQHSNYQSLFASSAQTGADIYRHLPPGASLIDSSAPITIGRAPDNHILVPIPIVSAHHAQIFLHHSNGKWRAMAMDVGSSNGTYLTTSGSVANLVPNVPTILLPDANVGIGILQISVSIQEQLGPDAVFYFVPKQDGFQIRNMPNPLTSVAHEAESDQAPPPIRDYFSNLPKRDIQTIPRAYRSLIPRPKGIVLFERFQTMLQEAAFMMSAPDRIAIRYFGPPGTAKTTIPEMIAHRMGAPLLRVPFSRRTDPSDLAGMWTIEEINGEMVPVFKEGAPTVAMEHGFHLVFDEPDLARAGVLAYANNVSAPGKFAWVRKQDGGLHQIAVHPDFRVWATENGVREVGREEHGKDFLRRFVPYYVGQWSETELATVLAQRYENHDGKPRWSRKVSQLLAHFHHTAQLLAEGMVDPETKIALPPLGSGIGQQIQFTPRSMLRLAQRLVSHDALTPQLLSRAIRAEYILPLADPVDQETVWSQAKAIFKMVGIDVAPEQIATPTIEELSKNYFGGKLPKSGKFVWTPQVVRLADEILWNKALGIDVMLLGEAGQGKTELPPQLAEMLGQTYYLKTISIETDEEDLVGGFGRVGGKIQFIPDIVAKGAEEGAITQLDEWFLGDSPKLESTTNSLMDDARALIIKSPYRVIPRHPKSFFIFTSNAPWGGYADRHEHSGALMSRAAVINLTGEFEMKAADRLQILQSWSEEPLPESQTGEARREFIRFSHKPPRPIPGQPAAEIPVSEEIQKKFKLPENVVFNFKTRELLEKSPYGDIVPLSEATKQGLKKFSRYMTLRTSTEMSPVTKRVFKILFHDAPGDFANLRNKEIHLGLAGLLNMSILGAAGVGKHEWAHATIDRPSDKYDAHEVGRLFANVNGDPRMNEYIKSLRPDFAEQIQAMVDGDWPEVFEEDLQQVFARKLPHEQFADAVIYYWKHGKVLPYIVHPAVLEALEKALPILEKCFKIFPTSTNDADVDVAAAEFYKVLDEAYPYYQGLIPEAKREILKRLENGERIEDLLQPIFEPLLKQLAQMLQAAHIKAKEKEHADAKAKAETPADDSILDDDDEADTQPMLPRPPAAEPEQNFEPPSRLPEGWDAEALKQMPPEELADKILEQRAEQLADRFEAQDPAAQKKRKEQIAKAKGKAMDGDASPGPVPPAPNASPHPMPSPAPAMPAQPAQAPDSADQPEPSALSLPSMLQPVSSVQALSGDELKQIEQARRAALQQNLQGDLFRTMVPPTAIKAANRLKRLMPPDDPAYMEGHFTNGKRLDRNKAVQDIIKPFPDGKVMLRLLRPGEYDVNLVKVSDVTGSIEQAGAKDNLLRSSAAATYLAEQLKIKYAEIVFGGTARVIKKLGTPMGTYHKKNELLRQVKDAFDDQELQRGGTNIRDAFAEAIELIRKSRAKSNYILLITDGGDNATAKTKKSLSELNEEAEKLGIHVLVLALGDAVREVPLHFKNYLFVAADGSDIPEKTVELFEMVHHRRMQQMKSP